jgi:hypothetical protein
MCRSFMLHVLLHQVINYLIKNMASIADLLDMEQICFIMILVSPLG